MAVILNLPPELLSYILSLIDIRDVCHCYQACRLLHDVVIATPRLQYNLGLAAAGMIDGPEECMLALVEKLRLFQLRHEAGRRLEPTVTLQVDNPLKVQHEHPTALDMRVPYMDVDIDDMQHGLLAANEDSEFLDWRNDPAQDLLVISDETQLLAHPNIVRFHLRTWSSRGSGNHPEALRPYFDINVDGERYDGTAWHLMGHLLAIVVRTGAAWQHLYVVDWKKDSTKLSVAITGDWQHDITDIQILDDSAVAVCTPANIGLYDIRGFHYTGNPLVVLQLPMRRYTICPVSFSQKLCRMRENIPFTIAPFTGDRIFVVQQSPYIAETGSRGFFYVMLVSSLLRVFRAADQANAGPYILPWNAWGPDTTRVLRNRSDLRLDRLISGTRILWPTFDIAPNLNILRYEILDFSRVPSARAGIARSEGSLASDFTLHEEESVTEAFHDGEQLIPAVQSRLVYSSATLSFDDPEATVSFGDFLGSVLRGWYPVELHEDRLTRVVKRGDRESGEVYVL